MSLLLLKSRHRGSSRVTSSFTEFSGVTIRSEPTISRGKLKIGALIFIFRRLEISVVRWFLVRDANFPVGTHSNYLRHITLGRAEKNLGFLEQVFRFLGF